MNDKQPNYGPIANIEEISNFAKLSNEAFELFDELVNKNWATLNRPTHHLFIRIIYQAKTTSFAINLNNSWVLILPAFSLLRVRLEQLIVCSYLVHEDEEIGLLPFVRHTSIREYINLRTAMEDEAIKDKLAHLIDFNRSEDAAIKDQEELTPGFKVENDKFSRDWTKLDLRSMAKRRDVLSAKANLTLDKKLELSYITLYRVASSLIHADCSSLSTSFLNLFSVPGGKPVLMPVPSWASIVAANSARYDIIQCCEVLNYLGIPVMQEYKSMLQSWDVIRSKIF